jgi:hypothetical protein
MKIECACTSCLLNEPFNNHYGYCQSEQNIVLKFRAAGDFGKGTIVFLECLNQTLKQEEP